MFLQEFEQSQSTLPTKGKRAKKEYSAGFRNYHPQKHSPLDDSNQNTDAESDLFDQLKIGNLKELYQQSKPVISNKHEVFKEQEQSILRLISRPQKPRVQKQEEQNEIPNASENRQKFLQTYHRVPNFEQTANASLFQSQFKKVQQKMKHKYADICKGADYHASLARFLLLKHQNIVGKELNNDQLLLEYTNFLNERHKQNQLEGAKIDREVLESILSKNLYLYAKFSLKKLVDKVIVLFNFQNLVRDEKEIGLLKEDSHLLRLLNKKFTVPYESQLCKQIPKISSIIDQISKQQAPLQKYVFHAISVPPTTYHKPNERPKSAQKAKTIAQPFNLTITNDKSKKNMENYYKWDRNFHARQIPKTTYQPHQIIAGGEAEKKRRATQLLQSAAFPSTMKYLQDFHKYSEQKTQTLKNKYAKNHQPANTCDKIPGFQQIHHNQIINLENRKFENRHPTKPQPFNLSQPKPRRQKQHYEPSFQHEMRIQGTHKSSTQTSKFQPQSTLKYQAYVNHVKKQKQQKQEHIANQKKRVEKQEKEKKVFKQILKERIDHQLLNFPKNNIVPQDLASNTVKVNLQKIYNYEPLLIERQAAKCKKQPLSHQKDWVPII